MADSSSPVWNATQGPRRLAGLGFVIVALAAWLWTHLPVADSPGYFDFADKAAQIGVPNFNDVASNAGFLAAGLYGLYLAAVSRLSPARRMIGAVLALASLLTAFGSSYFHWSPGPETLFWDRLPMTAGFSAILALALADRAGEKLGIWSLALLIPFGIWSVTGLRFGVLTLRPYIVVQFGSILLVLLTVLLRPRGRIRTSLFLTSGGLYALAKVFEMLDEPVFTLTGGLISGHTLKHLVAALAILKLLTFMKEPQI